MAAFFVVATTTLLLVFVFVVTPAAALSLPSSLSSSSRAASTSTSATAPRRDASPSHRSLRPPPNAATRRGGGIVVARSSTEDREGVFIDPDGGGGGDDGTGGGTTAAATATTTTTTTTRAATATGPRVVVNSATLRFNNMLSRMAKNVDSVTAPRVEALLLKAVKEYELHEDRVKSKDAVVDADGDDEDDDPSTATMVVPNTVSFTNAITSWARCTRKDSARRAQSLLGRMRDLRSTRGWAHVRPNRVTYNSVITAWARSGERGSASAAERLLGEMYDEFYDNQTRERDGGDVDGDAGDVCDLDAHDLKPDSRSWNAVINAVARSRDPDCADRARSLLDEMGRLYDMGDSDLVPDALTFGAVINAFANSGVAGASDRAAQLLLHMESLHQMGYGGAKPTTFVYNACMNAFAKDPLTGGGGVGGTTSLDRAVRAEQLLDSMERRYDGGGDVGVMPDCISYGTVINAYANGNARTSGERADAVLRRMVRRCLMGQAGCRPNAVVFTAAIKAHVASIYATLASADDEADEKEEEVVEEAEVEGENDASKPMAIRKNGKYLIMEASARRCEDLLLQLCLLHNQSRKDERPSLKPTSVTFELVIKALTQVNDTEGVERVKRLRELGTW